MSHPLFSPRMAAIFDCIRLLPSVVVDQHLLLMMAGVKTQYTTNRLSYAILSEVNAGVAQEQGEYVSSMLSEHMYGHSTVFMPVKQTTFFFFHLSF